MESDISKLEINEKNVWPVNCSVLTDEAILANGVIIDLHVFSLPTQSVRTADCKIKLV